MLLCLSLCLLFLAAVATATLSESWSDSSTSTSTTLGLGHSSAPLRQDQAAAAEGSSGIIQGSGWSGSALLNLAGLKGFARVDSILPVSDSAFFSLTIDGTTGQTLAHIYQLNITMNMDRPDEATVHKRHVGQFLPYLDDNTITQLAQTQSGSLLSLSIAADGYMQQLIEVNSTTGAVAAIANLTQIKEGGALFVYQNGPVVDMQTGEIYTWESSFTCTLNRINSSFQVVPVIVAPSLILHVIFDSLNRLLLSLQNTETSPAGIYFVSPGAGAGSSTISILASMDEYWPYQPTAMVAAQMGNVYVWMTSVDEEAPFILLVNSAGGPQAGAPIPSLSSLLNMPFALSPQSQSIYFSSDSDSISILLSPYCYLASLPTGFLPGSCPLYTLSGFSCSLGCRDQGSTPVPSFSVCDATSKSGGATSPSNSSFQFLSPSQVCGPTCDVVSHGPPSDGSLGNCTRVLVVGEWCQYTCDDGYVLDGPSSNYCSFSASSSGRAQITEYQRCDSVSSSHSSLSLSTMLLSCAGGLGSICLSFMTWYWRNAQAARRRQQSHPLAAAIYDSMVFVDAAKFEDQAGSGPEFVQAVNDLADRLNLAYGNGITHGLSLTSAMLPAPFVRKLGSLIADTAQHRCRLLPFGASRLPYPLSSLCPCRCCRGALVSHFADDTFQELLTAEISASLRQLEKEFQQIKLQISQINDKTKRTRSGEEQMPTQLPESLSEDRGGIAIHHNNIMSESGKSLESAHGSVTAGRPSHQVRLEAIRTSHHSLQNIPGQLEAPISDCFPSASTSSLLQPLLLDGTAE